jgi:hypothetical protein
VPLRQGRIKAAACPAEEACRDPMGFAALWDGAGVFVRPNCHVGSEPFPV